MKSSSIYYPALCPAVSLLWTSTGQDLNLMSIPQTWLIALQKHRAFVERTNLHMNGLGLRNHFLTRNAAQMKYVIGSPVIILQPALEYDTDTQLQEKFSSKKLSFSFLTQSLSCCTQLIPLDPLLHTMLHLYSVSRTRAKVVPGKRSTLCKKSYF